MMCQLNVYVVCNLATECKKDGSKKRSAYTLTDVCYRPLHWILPLIGNMGATSLEKILLRKLPLYWKQPNG